MRGWLAFAYILCIAGLLLLTAYVAFYILR